MKQSLYRGLFACALFVTLASSCQDEDFGYTVQDVKESVYARNFEKVFGKSDPNQDWSMATLVKANVNLPGLTGTAKMNICTGDPRNSSTRLLAQIMLKDGQGSIDFDAIKGSENVFVTVEQDGKYKVFGQYALQNGMLNVGNITPEMMMAAEPMTRAFAGTCPTTQSTGANRKDVEVDYSSDHEVFDCMKIRYPDTGTDERTLETWIADTKAFVGQHNGTGSFPFTDESVRHFAVINGVDDDNTTFVLNSTATLSTEKYAKGPYGDLKSFSDWKALAENRGENLKNNHGDFPYEFSSVMVFGPFTDESNNTYDVFKGFNWDNPVLKSGCSEYEVGEVVTYNGATKTKDDWKSEMASNASKVYDGSYDGPWENSGIKLDMSDCAAGTSGAVYIGIFPEDHWVLKDNAKEVPTNKTVKVKLQYLDNVETSPAPAWDAPLGYSFFGPGSFFAESVPYYTDGKKLNVYYDEAEMAEMEKGFCIKTTSTGPIELPYIFGCTDYSNQFGYIYWKDGDELKPDFNPYELKHFVLIEDARPQSNIKEAATSNAVGPKELGTWDANLSGEWMDVRPDQYEAAANHSYVGTTYRVMYFGDDYSNTTGTYDFPAGYRIAFFITTLSTSNTTASDEEKLFTTHHEHGNGTKFNYSLPEFNEGLNHLNTKRSGGPRGMVKCIVWNHDGNTYMGFGDNSGDEDLNDIVFLVNGNFTPTTPVIKVAPIKWHLNYEGIHHDGNNGTVKDDDLYFQESKNVGGTYSKPNGTPIRDGYVFKGWAATPTGPVLTDDKLTNVTVEDENGACYYAIWVPAGDPTPGPDPDPISWIFACEDLGGSFDYDFNDVVWEVQKIYSEGTCTGAQVSILAAGGTLPFTLKYNGTTICTKLQAFDGIEDTDVVNAGEKAGTSCVSKDPKVFNVDGIGADWNISSNYTKFTVDVHSATETYHISAYSKKEKPSDAPQVILLPGEWEWPTEETPIDNAYTNFTTWVTDGKAAPWSSWSSHKQSGTTVSHSIWNGGGETGGEDHGSSDSYQAVISEIRTINYIDQWGGTASFYGFKITTPGDLPDGSYTLTIGGTYENAAIWSYDGNSFTDEGCYFVGSTATADSELIAKMKAGNLYITNRYNQGSYTGSTFSNVTLTLTPN